jgi:hypothetical protein
MWVLLGNLDFKKLWALDYREIYNFSTGGASLSVSYLWPLAALPFKTPSQPGLSVSLVPAMLSGQVVTELTPEFISA